MTVKPEQLEAKPLVPTTARYRPYRSPAHAGRVAPICDEFDYPDDEQPKPPFAPPAPAEEFSYHVLFHLTKGPRLWRWGMGHWIEVAATEDREENLAEWAYVGPFSLSDALELPALREENAALRRELATKMVRSGLISASLADNPLPPPSNDTEPQS